MTTNSSSSPRRRATVVAAVAHDLQTIRTGDGPFESVPPGHDAAIDKARRQEYGEWQAEPGKDGQCELKIVGIAIVEGEAGEGRPAGSAQSVESLAEVDHRDAPVTQMPQEPFEKFGSDGQRAIRRKLADRRIR